MIIITAARMIGLKHDGQLDYIWEIFFIAIAGEIGLMLVAVTAFRALYVSRAKTVGHQTITTFNWYHRSKSVVQKLISSFSGKPRSSDVSKSESGGGKEGFFMGDIPRGTITGVRTFIRKNGADSVVDVEHLGDSDSERRMLR